MGKIFKGNLLAKITCLILSFGLWMYIITVENPVKRKTFRDVPVTYSNVNQLKNKDLVIAPNQTLTSNITVEGPFNTILNTTGNGIYLIMDFDGKALVAGENKIPVNAVLPNGLIQRGVIEKTIILEPLVTKQFNVKSMLNLETANKNYYAPQPEMKEIVLVSGAKSMVEQVANVIAKESFAGLEAPIDKLVKLIPVDKDGLEIKTSVVLDKNYAPVKIAVYPISQVTVNEKPTGKLNDGLVLKSMKINKPEVRIAGPKAVLDTIKSVETTEIPLDKVSLNQIDFPVKLELPKEIVLLDDNNVPLENSFAVKVNVETRPSKQFNKEVTLSGKAQTNTVSIEGPKNVTIQVSGDKNKLDTLDTATISASVDITNLPIGKHEIDVKVTLPSDFTMISTSPGKVTVLVAP